MSNIEPDPSMIGGVAKVPLVQLPKPQALFEKRAARFDFLAEHSPNLAPYLRFLAGVARAQAHLVAELPTPAAPSPEWVDTARAARMPQLDRNKMKDGVAAILDRFCTEVARIEMPEASRNALSAVQAAGPEDRDWLISNILTDQIPADGVAIHLFGAAAVQVHAAMLAAVLDAEKLVPIKTGICPSCGGKPSVSFVTDDLGAEGTRFAACSCCQTLWNEVRVKCLCCGSAKGLSLRAVEAEDAMIKAETCSECDHWVKLLYQNRNASIEPVADDVASLGLDLKMQETQFKKWGFNPFLVGY